MKRLAEENINTPDEYDRIYGVRSKGRPDWFDVRRWRKLLKHFRGGVIVDLGCLDSLVLPMAKKISKKSLCIGLDQAEAAVKGMAEKYPNIIYGVESLYNIRGLKKESANYAVLGEVLEHVDFPKIVVAEALRILKPGGILAVSVPLNEAVEPGAVDKDRHLWSFELSDLVYMTSGIASLADSEVLRSRRFPFYRYQFPNLVAWFKKKPL